VNPVQSSSGESRSATDRLVAELATHAQAVTPLSRPWKRALIWQAIALSVLCLFFLSSTPRADLAEKLAQSGFWLEIGLQIVTASAAAFACFLVALPDRSSSWVWLPIVPALGWLAVLTPDCLAQIVDMGWHAFTQGHSPGCTVLMLSVSLPLAASLLVMQRHAGRTRPRLTFAMGMIAVAGFSAATLNFFHEIDAAATVLFWHLGSALLIVGIWAPIGGWLARFRLDRAERALRRAAFRPSRSS
jgi:hypothetical protein